MDTDNNLPQGGTAELIEDSQAQIDLELEDKVGAAIADSLDEDGEQPKEQKTKTAEDETTDEESTEEAEEEPKAEDETEEEPEKQTTIKFKDGSEHTLEELERSFLRQSDYTRKTQELAREKAETSSLKGTWQTELQAVKRELEYARQVATAFQPRPPDMAMLQSDPIGFMAQKEVFERSNQVLARIQSGLAATDSRLNQSDQSRTAVNMEQEMAALTERLPSLRTDQGRAAFFKEAAEVAGKAYGFTPEEIGSFQDHRYIVALRDAVEYRKLQGKKMEAVRKAKDAPPLKSTGRQAPNQRANQVQQKAWDRLRQEQSEEAAAAALPNEWFD